MNQFVDSFVEGLCRSSFVLAIAAVLVALCIRGLRVTSPRAEQWAWLLVLIQGVLFAPIFILPIPEAWQRSAVEVRSPTAERLEQPQMLRQVELRDSQSVVDPTPNPTPDMNLSAAASISYGERSHSIRWPQPTRIAFTVWAFGFVGILSVALLRYIRFVCQLKNVRDPLPEWSDEFQMVLHQMGMSSRLQLAISDGVGPMLCRLPRRSLVVVPETLWTELSAMERLAILRHEMEHARRGDLVWTLVARLLATLHWFNPCAWWAAANFDVQGEFACDQAAANGDERLQFADLLMRLGTGTYLQLSGFKAFASGRTYERIRRLIVAPAISSAWRSTSPLVLALLVFCIAAIKPERSHSGVLGQSPSTSKATSPIELSTDPLLRLGAAPFATRDFPSDFAFSSDSRWVAAAESNSDGHVIRVFDIATGAETMKLADPQRRAGWFMSIAFSPDGKTLAGGDPEGYLFIWDLTQQRLRFGEKVVSDRIRDVIFSPDGEWVVVSSASGGLQLRATANPASVVRELLSRTQGSDGSYLPSTDIGAQTMAFTVDGSRLIVTHSPTNEVHVWDVATGQLQLTLNSVQQQKTKSRYAVTSISLSADGKSVLVSGFGKAVREKTTLAYGPKYVYRPQNRIWNLETGQLERDVSSQHDYGTGTAALLPDNRRMVVSYYDQLVLRNLDDLADQIRIPLNGDWSNNLVLSPEGKYVALQLGGRLALFDTATGQRLHSDAQTGTDHLMSADWSSRGDRIATAGSDGKVRVWDATTGLQLWSQRLAPYIAPTGSKSTSWFVAFDERHQWVVAAGDRDDAKTHRCGTVVIFDATTGQMFGDVSVRKPIRGGAVAPNGQLAVVAGTHGGINDTQLYGIDLVNRKVRFVGETKESSSGIWSVAAIEFVPDSSAFRVATGDSHILELDAQTGKLRSDVSIDWRNASQQAENKPQVPHLWSGAFTPDASLLVSSSEDHVYLWDAKTGQQESMFPHPHKNGCYLTISRNGQTIVTSDFVYMGDYGEDTIRFYGTSGNLQGMLNPGDARARVLMFSPDDTKLLTGFFGQPAAIWDAN